jgi:hypothetical protein
MPNIPKAMFIGHSFGPFFNCATFDFNCVTTTLAYQVVMMRVTAKAIDGFTIISAQKIDNLVIN